MTREEFKNFTEKDLHEIASEIAQNITIRSYDNGSSVDTKRSTTKPEAEIISNIAFAALYAYRWRDNGTVDSILDVAEMALDQFFPEANGYDTIYLPLKKAMGLF